MYMPDFFPPSSSGPVFTPRLRQTKAPRMSRRARRRIARVVGTPRCSNLVETLCIWAAGMPWVVETQVTAEERFRLFVVDCPDLSRHAPWFAVETIPEGEFALDHGIYLILPQDLVRSGVENGWAMGDEVVGAQRSLTAVASPTSDEEFRALQRLLEGTYEAAFG